MIALVYMGRQMAATLVVSCDLSPVFFCFCKKKGGGSMRGGQTGMDDRPERHS